MKILRVTLLAASVLMLSFQSRTHGDLKISITGIRNSDGEIDLHLFNSPDGFAKDESKALKHLRGKISNGACLITIENLPFGKYAFIIYHDENNDKQMNKAWYGKPIEGIAASNHAKGGIAGPPGFEEAKFDLNSETDVLIVRIKYF